MPFDKGWETLGTHQIQPDGSYKKQHSNRTKEEVSRTALILSATSSLSSVLYQYIFPKMFLGEYKDINICHQYLYGEQHQ